MFFSLATVNLLGIHVVAQRLIYLSHEDLEALLQRRCQGRHLAEGARAVASLSLVKGRAPWDKLVDLTKKNADFMGFHGISWDFVGFHGISWDFEIAQFLLIYGGSPFKALMTWMIWGTPILGSLHLEISMVTQTKIV